MELLYNPDSMTEQEIKGTFVARHELIEELTSLVQHQPDGAGVQHAVIIAPRGMGKTTVLLMLQFAVRESDLANHWQAVRFAEESYGVYDLSDFWLEAIDRLAADTDDTELLKRADELKAEYPNSDELQEATLALLKDWRRTHGKRLVLLVDNFDLILDQINDEQDNARLRDALMNDGTIMLIGGATTFFHEARAYDQPLYNFFKTYNLNNLRFEQMQELLRRRAEIDKVENFEATIKANESRLRVLEYFTGGNPRLVLMLYRVVTHSDISEVRRGLEKLLDEATPFYKAKVESLPPQLRKILDFIARESSRTHEGVRPAEIATATRMKPNQVSAQLKRLSELGYVRAANLRERNSYYTLSEPLYAIWHQMRFGRDARQRMQWLVDFLKVWYDAAEMDTESKRLDSNFREHLSAGRLHEAKDALDHRRYLAEAMSDLSTRTVTLEAVIRSYIELKDLDTLKTELLTSSMLQNLSEQTLALLCQSGCITEEMANDARTSASVSVAARQRAEFEAAMKLSLTARSAGRMEDAVKYADQALEIDPASAYPWATRSAALQALGRHEEAIASFDRALETASGELETISLAGQAISLLALNRYEEANKNHARLVQIIPNESGAWFLLGGGLLLLEKTEEAIASFDRALEINPDIANYWHFRGFALGKAGKYEEALVNFDRALKLEPNMNQSWYRRGLVLFYMSKYEEAITSYDRALEIAPNSNHVHTYRVQACMSEFAVQVINGNISLATKHLGDALKSAQYTNADEFYTNLAEFFLALAIPANLELIQQLIIEAKLEDQLFPLARAIDVVLTGNDALVEKLSPEVQGIVRDVVKRLRKTTGQAKLPKKKEPRNAKPASRGRTRKQLK